MAIILKINPNFYTEGFVKIIDFIVLQHELTNHQEPGTTEQLSHDSTWIPGSADSRPNQKSKIRSLCPGRVLNLKTTKLSSNGPHV